MSATTPRHDIEVKGYVSPHSYQRLIAGGSRLSRITTPRLYCQHRMEAMVRKWRGHLIKFGLLVFLSLTLAACGGDDPVGNDDPNQDPQKTDDCESDDDCPDDKHCIVDTCYEDEPIDCEDTSECGADMPYCVEGVCYHTCEVDEHCGDEMLMCDEGICIEDPEADCRDNDDCGSDYCHDGSCVSESFICTLQNCAGQRGVCDPEAGAEGECINADHCSSLDSCIDDYLCVDNECVEEDAACADCTEDEDCLFDADTLSVECKDTTVICEAGLRECIDENTLYICSSDGTIEHNQPCPEGCNEEELRCEQTPGETCEDAIPVENGDSFEFDWIEYANSFQPDGSEGCIDPSDDLRVASSDVAFELELEPEQVGVVELYTPFDNTMMYMFDDCPGASGDYSCQDPSGHTVDQLDDGVRRSLWIENDGDESETYRVVVDSSTGASDQSATVDITISDQICEPGQPVCSDGELGECSTQGTHFLTDSDLSCALGCDSDDPADAACEPKAHSVCEDAVAYEGAGVIESFTYDIIDFGGEDFWDTGNCLQRDIGTGQSDTFEGNSAYFEVEMAENERLNANLASHFEAGLWIREGCEGLCHEASNQPDNSESLEFVADEDQTVYVVVHAVDEDILSGEFTLDLSVDEPACDGYEEGDILGCLDDSTIQYCVGSNYPETYHCESDCEDGACVEPSGDSCIEPIVMDPDGESMEGAFDDVSAGLTPLSCGGDDLDGTPSGPDTVYQLELTEPNQLIQVDLTTTSSSAGVYLLDECPVAKSGDDFSDECLDGEVPGDDAEFFVEDPGTYYLVVDSTNQNDQAAFSLDVDIVYSDCLPHAQRCHQGDLELCAEGEDGDFSYQVIQNCLADCDDLICVGPEEANNRCGPGEGFDVNSSGTIEDNFDRFSPNPDENLAPGECFEGGTNGADVFYRVDLAPQQGVIVDATVDIGASDEAGLYIAEGCPSDSGVDCAMTTSFSESGTLEFYSADGGVYDLGLAALSSFDSGDFILEFDFFDGECDPEEDNICVGETAEQCTDLGILEETECEYGCVEGSCRDKEGDFCERPFDIDEDGSVDGDGTITFEHQGNLSDYQDNYNPYDDGDSCTGHVGNGPDVVFAFEGWAGDEVDLSLTSQYDSALWVTTDCDDAAASCIEGVDDVFGPSVDTPEALSFTAPHQATYYVIADAVQNGATGDFTLDATIEPGDRFTDATFDVTETEIDLQAKVDEEDAASFYIENDGEIELSFDIDEDADWLDVSPTNGTVSGESSSEVALSSTCPSDAGIYSETLYIDSDAPFDSSGEVEVTLDCWDYGSIEADVQGLPDDVDHNIDVEDEAGNNVGSLDEDGVIGELEPGTYHLLPQNVEDTDTGLVYEADVVEDVEVNSNEAASAAVEYAALPSMAVSEDALELEALVEEDDSATFDITNDGDQDLTFEIDDDISWLEASPADGSVDGESSTTITVTATCPSDADTYEETLTITSNAASDSTAGVEVTLECDDE